MIQLIGFFVLNIIVFFIGYYRGALFAAETTSELTYDALKKLPKEMQDAFQKALEEAVKENNTND